MGYHHCHVPDMEQIQREFESLGLDEFIRNLKRDKQFIRRKSNGIAQYYIINT